MSFFIVPIEGAGTKADPRRPKYIPALGVQWSMCDLDEAAIVWAATSPSQDTAVDANADATLIPPLQNSVNVAQTQAALEALNIPAQWITSAMTYRTVLRVVVGIAQFIQRTEGLGQKLTLAGRLDLTMSQIPVAIRDALLAAADSLNIDRSAIVGTTTVREALRDLGQQFARRRIVIGDL